MDFQDRSKALTDLTNRFASSGIRYAQIETPDINGTLRGKLVQLEKAMSPQGGAFCTILYGLSNRDDVYESEFSSFDNGFPDACAVADPDTAVVIDEERGIASVICDMLTPDRSAYYGLSPRTALRRAASRAEKLGYLPRFAVELEVYIVKAERERIDSGRMHSLPSFGRLHNAYSLARMDELRLLAVDFMTQMEAFGIAVEAIHTELGHGMIEVAIAHMPVLEAADACARVKLYLKEFFSHHGYATVFMPKWRMDESGSGGHTHQSLWRDGKPAFADDCGKFSSVGLQYVAGQLATLKDFAAVFYPTVNAYRRMDVSAWSPENVSWGMDNRTCALRVITQPSPSAYRIEHRCPGADINGYLSLACMLWGGLNGIEAALDLPEPVVGNSSDVPSLEKLPKDLASATSALSNSKVAEDALGRELLQQYVISREDEWRLWQNWQDATISDWELVRYFDMH